MKTVRFIGLALITTYIVWHLNFRNVKDDADVIHEINRSTTLALTPGQMHVLVTGGAGYIGSHATLLLLEHGHTVTVLDNLSRGNIGALLKVASLVPPARLRFLNVDLGDRAALLAAMQESKPPIDLVMHFAAVAYVGESVHEPIKYYSNITINTIHVLDCMKEAGIHKLVYSSTCAVYGNPARLPVTEETPALPINPYGAAKLAAEDVIRSVAKATPGFTAVLLRYFNVYGSDPQGRLGEYPRPDLRGHARISGACMDAALGFVPELRVIGTQHPTPDGSCVRDFVHVSDLVAAHVTAMVRTANPPALYNVGTGKGVSVVQFVEACKKVTGRPIKVVMQAEARPGDYAEVYADPAKIFHDWGWRPNYTDVEDGLRHAWNWRRANPEGYAT